jgi:hypothetical protein
MKNKKWSIIIALIASIIIVVLGLRKIYLYGFVVAGAQKYPSGVMQDLAIYAIDPENILAELDQGSANVFMPALQNPIYDDIPPVWQPGSFSWSQEDHLKVATALHEYNWNEGLDEWKLYSLDFSILDCEDISRIDHASFGFYQRDGDWYYSMHNMTIDLEYGLVYAGNDNGYYSGNWKDFDFDNSIVNTANEILFLGEQNGGEQARLKMINDPDCQVNIFFAPFVQEEDNWGWKVTYKLGNSFIYGITIDPYTGKYQILKPIP